VKEKVIVTAYQIWKEDADAVDASTGIVKIIEDIRSVLDNNDLGITNVLNCYTINISPSELLTMSSLVTIKKSATLIIEKYEASSI
jgi:archaellum biogenesis protein FlaJ (TadC family)